MADSRKSVSLREEDEKRVGWKAKVRKRSVLMMKKEVMAMKRRSECFILRMIDVLVAIGVA